VLTYDSDTGFCLPAAFYGISAAVLLFGVCWLVALRHAYALVIEAIIGNSWVWQRS
jgi:hypothetical protein